MSNGNGDNTIDMIGTDGLTYPMPLNKVRDALAAGGVIKGSPTEMAGQALAASGIPPGSQLQSAAQTSLAPVIPQTPMQTSPIGSAIDYARGIAKGGFATTAGAGAAAGGPQYLQGGGINQPQVNYTVPQSMQPEGTAQKAGYYTEKIGELAAPLVFGGAAASEALPNAKRAGAAIQAVTDAAGDLPVDTNGPMQIAQRIQQLGKAGGQVPKVVRDFLNRMGVSVEGETVTQAPSRLTFGEGRDFYNNSTRLSSGEYQTLTKPVQRLVGQFTDSLHNALVGSADQVGMGRMYDNAVGEYGAASQISRVASDVGKYLLKQGLQWGPPAALGYEGLQALRGVRRR